MRLLHRILYCPQCTLQPRPLKRPRSKKAQIALSPTGVLARVNCEIPPDSSVDVIRYRKGSASVECFPTSRQARTWHPRCQLSMITVVGSFAVHSWEETITTRSR